jgi:uncharacterized protein involved in exopolysaccharide biosynthesis
MSMYSQLLESVSAPLLGQLGTGTAPETIYIDMLKSRTITEQIIDEFDLQKVYKAYPIERAIETFQSHCGYTLLVNGLIVMTYEDRDPERAAAVANRMIDLLDELNTNIKMSKAAHTRVFIGGQLQEREQELAAAESALRDFQESHKALQLDQQLKSAMDIIAGLTGKAISLETQLRILSEYTSKSSEEYLRKQTEYDQVVDQLRRLKQGGEGDEDMVRSYIPALDEVPDLALELLRLKREVEIQSTVYTMLVKEHEKARIEEARDTRVVQVLDTASVPTLRSRPRRKILVIVGAVVGAGWAAVMALFLTLWREGGEGTRRWREVFAPVVSDLKRLLRRRPRSSS